MKLIIASLFLSMLILVSPVYGNNNEEETITLFNQMTFEMKYHSCF